MVNDVGNSHMVFDGKIENLFFVKVKVPTHTLMQLMFFFFFYL